MHVRSRTVLSLEYLHVQAQTEMNDGLSTCDQPGISYQCQH